MQLPEGGAPLRLVRPVFTKDGLFRCLVLEWLVSRMELPWSEKLFSSKKLPVPTRALVIMSFKSFAGLINIIFILNVNSKILLYYLMEKRQPALQS